MGALLRFHLHNFLAAVVAAGRAHAVRQDQGVTMRALHHRRRLELPIGLAHIAARRRVSFLGTAMFLSPFVYSLKSLPNAVS